ncbi:hypothetical protein HMPREF9996_02080 [Aggregatibacter actinomycetemcomitans Y4]|nr:hypothetical protein HMPREF9996_02080 [Aggregatibacter actinomycetemcomitans Y4]
MRIKEVTFILITSNLRLKMTAFFSFPAKVRCFFLLFCCGIFS